MRYIGQSWVRQVQLGQTPRIDPADIGETLQQAIAKLG